ncbi:MAG: carboxymuconolactone decarboxylase family protein [Alcanivoracaceae bacterium]
MADMPVLTDAELPDSERDLLAQVKDDFGFIPNLERVLAQAPAALRGYVALWDLISATSLTPLQQQLVCQQINRLHDCHYCMAHHDVLLRQAGADANTRQALLEDKPLADASLEALRAFTVALVETRGVVSPDQQQDFLAAGYSAQQMLDIILVLACKVISNYSNHLAHTPLEPFVKPVT